MAKTILIFLVSICFMVSTYAVKPNYSCAFKKPLIFGASISAGYSGLGDIFRGLKAAKAGKRYLGKLKPPTARLAEKYYPGTAVTNIAEIISHMTHSSFGYRQLAHFVADRQNKQVIADTSILVSLDGFYWPAVFGDCAEAVQGVNDIIDTAWRLNKPLILATVPEEDPSKVRKSFKRFWKPPRKSCLQRINAEMNANCMTKNSCYVIDVHAIVKSLNGKGVVHNGKTYFAADFRKDGIHFTEMGVKFAMQVIEGTLSKNPPICVP